MSKTSRRRGKSYPSKGSVFVKIEMNQTNVAMARFGSAVFDLGLQVTNTHQLSAHPRAYASAMVKVPIENIDELKSYMKFANVEYQSPTYFNRGSICPIYASPEDEIADICTPGYAKFLKYNGEAE